MCKKAVSGEADGVVIQECDCTDGTAHTPGRNYAIVQGKEDLSAGQGPGQVEGSSVRKLWSSVEPGGTSPY